VLDSDLLQQGFDLIKKIKEESIQNVKTNNGVLSHITLHSDLYNDHTVFIII
jgi:hypothetical protein